MQTNFDKTSFVKIFASLSLLIVGAIIYCNFKSNPIIYYFLDPFLLKKKFSHNTDLTIFIYNWGCDIIWCCAFYLMLSVFCKNTNVFFIIFIVSTAYEIAQLFNNKLGTFDVLDILIDTISITVMFCFFKYVRKED